VIKVILLHSYFIARAGSLDAYINAMGYQRAICAQIIVQGGDHLIALRVQGMLHKDV
jgi:hypothetical protein